MNIKKDKARFLCTNKKAMFNYEEVESFEAGIKLLGTEVKCIRLGRGNLSSDSYVGFDEHGLVLFNFEIGNLPTIPIQCRHDQLRNKRILMRKSEIKKMQGKVKSKGMTLIAKNIYNSSRGIIKLTISLCKGKKLHDKRRDLKEKDLKMQMKRELKGIR